jgi:hypothetical protein
MNSKTPRDFVTIDKEEKRLVFANKHWLVTTC